jgi:hypothetical protein
LKLLPTDVDSPAVANSFVLRRNEFVALFNGFARFVP